MDRDALHDLLLERIGASADVVLREAQPAVRLSRQLIKDEDIPVGASKIGGRPDIPPGVVWPGRYQIAHSFLAQINLADVAPHDEAQLLPISGRLYFFYGLAFQVSGFNPDDRGGWTVLYDDAAVSDLIRTDPPSSLVALDSQFYLLQNGLYMPIRLTPQATWTLPDRYSERGIEITRSLGEGSESESNSDEEDEDKDEIAEEDAYSYAGVVAKSRSAIAGPRHQMLGYPTLVQGDMELECQLVSHGIYCGNGRWKDDPRTPALEAGARNWVLLLQIDTDLDARLEWGDAARLYFWIERHALAERRFADVWFVYQSG